MIAKLIPRLTTSSPSLFENDVHNDPNSCNNRHFELVSFRAHISITRVRLRFHGGKRILDRMAVHDFQVFFFKFGTIRFNRSLRYSF